MKIENVTSFYDEIKDRLIETMTFSPISRELDLNLHFDFREIEGDQYEVMRLTNESASFNRSDLEMAWSTWSSMESTDRMEVITCFCRLYQKVLSEKNAHQKTLLFCSLFLERFIPVLSSV